MDLMADSSQLKSEFIKCKINQKKSQRRQHGEAKR